MAMNDEILDISFFAFWHIFNNYFIFILAFSVFATMFLALYNLLIKR